MCDVLCMDALDTCESLFEQGAGDRGFEAFGSVDETEKFALGSILTDCVVVFGYLFSFRIFRCGVASSKQLQNVRVVCVAFGGSDLTLEGGLDEGRLLEELYYDFFFRFRVGG